MFEWDDQKEQSNILKHGISFEEAKQVFQDPKLVTVIDDRFDYGEIRSISLGQLLLPEQPLLIALVVHTNREGKIRIISARKASRKERKLYERQAPIQP